MDPTSETPKPFYAEGQDAGRIADVGPAQELANLEKPARDREAELKRQAGGGLTETQRKSIELMDGLEAKYPLAFKDFQDSKGRKVLLLGNPDSKNGEYLLFTQEGVVGHALQERGSYQVYVEPEQVDLEALTECLSRGEYQQDIYSNRGEVMFLKDKVLEDGARLGYREEFITFFRPDFSSDFVIQIVKKVLEKNQKKQEEYRKEQDERATKLEPKNLLNEL